MVKHAYGPSRKSSYTLWDLWIDVSFSLAYKTAGSRLETDEKLGADSYHSTAQTSWGDHQLSHRPASPWFGIFNPPDIIPFHPFHVYLGSSLRKCQRRGSPLILPRSPRYPCRAARKTYTYRRLLADERA